jgi:glycosyltransferase involved in cell wall biosynthesis
MAHVPESVTLVIVGEGSHRWLIERAAEEAGVTARVRFAGAVHDDVLVTLYREALALAYVPFDEDYGLATLEAFLAAKPVVTAFDSGGTLEFVQDDVNGLVCPAEPAEIGAAIARLAAEPVLAVRLGEAGRALALGITWDAVVDRLVSHG